MIARLSVALRPRCSATAKVMQSAFALQSRCFSESGPGWEVGDKVPIKFMKEEEDPALLKDEEYPEWLKTMTDKLPTKNQLLEKYYDKDVPYTESFTEFDIMRTKRLLTLEKIKEDNIEAAENK